MEITTQAMKRERKFTGLPLIPWHEKIYDVVGADAGKSRDKERSHSPCT
jgi:hypothetical protein